MIGQESGLRGWRGSTRIAHESIEFTEAARTTSRSIDKTTDPAAWRYWQARAVWSKYMVIYRTLANPAYVDLTIDPDDREMGSLFAYPDPMEGNYRRNGMARTMTARGWLSTWSALVEQSQDVGHDADHQGPDAAHPSDRRHRDPSPRGAGDLRELRCSQTRR